MTSNIFLSQLREPPRQMFLLTISLFLLSIEVHAQNQTLENQKNRTNEFGFDVDSIPQDLFTPQLSEGLPKPGIRVKQVNDGYENTKIYHTIYLPEDWEEGKKYPVIIEYAGNKWKDSPGTVEGSNLGYGISEGKGVIWICIPFVDVANAKNALNWWGDVEATVDYCKKTVARVSIEYGGDPSAIFLAGFSRGAIACNFIGLYDAEIAALWRGMICHSHYDGVKKWAYEGSDQKSALSRLARLKDIPQFISHENNNFEKELLATKEYLTKALPDGQFTFHSASFKNHTDTWVLRNTEDRRVIRKWFYDLLND
jgi:hypothetical protein